MSEAVRLAISFAVASAVAALATPLARRVATATAFYDHPAGYKQHLRPTPYLGGMAVVLATAVSSLIAFGAPASEVSVVLGCGGALLAVGTIDDRVGLGVLSRLVIQVAAAFALWATNAGWHLFGSEAANLGVTLLWVVGLINAFNLLDSLDGSTGTFGGVAAAGAGALAIAKGDPTIAALALTLSGACLGFLPSNLARPSLIFLGDGGSMPIGLIVAAVVMSIPQSGNAWATLLAAAPLAGVAIFDTSLVVLSRWRRGAPILSGARDHLTHRLMTPLASARRVALALGIAQGMLCGLAFVLYYLEPDAVIAGGVAYLAIGVLVLVRLESRLLAPSLAREYS